MNYKKEIAKKNRMSPASFWQTRQFCHFFTPVAQLFCSILHWNWPTTYNEHFTAYNIMTYVCPLVDCTKCSEYFVQLFEPWTWLVCMLACVRLCVTSQLSRATLMSSCFRPKVWLKKLQGSLDWKEVWNSLSTSRQELGACMEANYCWVCIRGRPVCLGVNCCLHGRCCQGMSDTQNHFFLSFFSLAIIFGATVYTVEAGLKMTGLGPKQYFNITWNV